MNHSEQIAHFTKRAPAAYNISARIMVNVPKGPNMFNFQDRIDLWLRAGFGALILIGCYLVIEPFLTAIILAAILTVVSWPLYRRALSSTGGSSTFAALIMVMVVVITVLIPLSLLCGVLAHQIPEVIEWFRHWVTNGMPLPEWLTSLPYVGQSINDAFHFGVDPKALGSFIQKSFDPLSKWILGISVGIGNGLFQLALVAFVAFFFYRDGQTLARRLRLSLNKISGDLAKEYADILINTTRSVVFGVIGTAIGQGLVAAVGFLIAGVPGVVMLSFAVCMLSVVPVGPPLVWGPVALWLFSTGQTGWAVFMVFWGLLAISSVDNFIKPILISRGTTLPLALVFLGVLGGIMTFGMLGLVLGPILLSASIAMFQSWLKNPARLKAPDKNTPAADENNAVQLAAAKSSETSSTREAESPRDGKSPESPC